MLIIGALKRLFDERYCLCLKARLGNLGGSKWAQCRYLAMRERNEPSRYWNRCQVGLQPSVSTKLFDKTNIRNRGTKRIPKGGEDCELSEVWGTNEWRNL